MSSFSKKVSKTAWSHSTSHPSSSFTSDLLSTRKKESNNPSKGKKPKDAQVVAPSKSREVMRLEKIIDALVNGVSDLRDGGQDGGCFCLGRTHELSPYTPLCAHCGFIMCDLQSPSSACPSCHSPLLSPTACIALIKKIEAQKAGVLEEEERERERQRIRLQKEEEERAGGGAFPTLPAGGPPPPLLATKNAPEPRTSAQVLSIGSKNGKKVITRTTIRTPPISGRGSPALPEGNKENEPEPEELPTRIPPPPDTVEHPSHALFRLERRWLDLRGGEPVYYVPLKPVGKQRGDIQNSGSAKRRKKKAKEAQNEAAEQG